MLLHLSHLPFLVSIGAVPVASYRGRRTDAAEARRVSVYDHRVHPDATFGNVNSRNRIDFDIGQHALTHVSIDTISDLIALAEADIAGRLP